MTDSLDSVKEPLSTPSGLWEGKQEVASPPGECRSRRKEDEEEEHTHQPARRLRVCRWGLRSPRLGGFREDLLVSIDRPTVVVEGRRR